MTPHLFEQLLNEEEGSTLDFKQAQYKFSKVTDEEKSEVLKDILAFANAWRWEDAYILIGVNEVRGDRSNVVGIDDHLDDHSLQQFVNHLTNRPIEFSYEAFGFDGKQIGIIKIDRQTRPFYLKKSFGRLNKDVVYLRRGSSTCTASVDEIARMGQPAGIDQAELSVQFAATEHDTELGTTITIESESCEMPTRIPSLRPQSRGGLGSFSVSMADHPNINFFRQMAEYIVMRRLFRPIRLVIENTGDVAANDVRIELSTASGEPHGVLPKGDLPNRPYRDHFRSLTGGIRTIHDTLRRKQVGESTVRKDKDHFVVEVECGGLQPGRKVWSNIFYIGRQESGEIIFTGQVLAVNLAKPMPFKLTAVINVAKTQMTNDELATWPDAGQVSDDEED